MSIKDYRTLDVEARKKELEGLLREQFNLRMQKATAQLANSSAIRKVRRNIARLRTVMNEGKGKQA